MEDVKAFKRGKNYSFKSLDLSKIVYLFLLTSIPNNTIEELIKIQKTFN